MNVIAEEKFTVSINKVRREVTARLSEENGEHYIDTEIAGMDWAKSRRDCGRNINRAMARFERAVADRFGMDS